MTNNVRCGNQNKMDDAKTYTVTIALSPLLLPGAQAE
jgi:hypothetical protein